MAESSAPPLFADTVPMAEQHPLLPLLACPRCVKARLVARKDALRCRRCGTEFPELKGIPWLFANPTVSWEEWRGRYHFARRRLEEDAGRLDGALGGEDLRGSTRRRLESLRDAYRGQVEILDDLLAPLELGGLEANFTTYLALRTRLPSDQGIHRYDTNVHRDWGWGAEENEASLALLPEALGEARTVLVLGAGAGRLAYDLHQTGQSATTIAMDWNPMLLLLAKTLCGGGHQDLYEFPIAPRAQPAVLHTLEAPEASRPGLELVGGDLLRAPFAPGSFDAVVTPWLIDVVPEEFSVLAERIGSLLRIGGRWVNFGSLAFSNQNAAHNYGLEECLEIVKASGFTTPAHREETIPYLCSPHSRHARRETVVVFDAEKREDRDAPPRHVALPDYLVTGEAPVPLLRSFEIQAMTTRIHAFLMTLVDGKRSIRDMAALMEEHGLMPSDEAEARVRNFLIKMYEESQKQVGF